MCKGMNRSIFNVVLGGFGTEGGTAAAGAGAGDRLVRSGSAEDAAFIMKNASYDEVFELEEINRDFASSKPGGRECEEPPPPAIPVSFPDFEPYLTSAQPGGRVSRTSLVRSLMAIRTWDCRLIAADEREGPLLSHIALPDRTPGQVDRCAVMRSKQPALVPNASLSNRDWNSPRRGLFTSDRAAGFLAVNLPAPEVNCRSGK
jgi:hypothetical protein